MSFTDKFLFFIFLLLGLTIGLSLSKIYQNIGFIKFNGEINIISAASLFITTVIAIGIPLFLKKFIDDNRSVKSFLADEILALVTTLCEIKTILTNCHGKGVITPDDKNNINYIFHTADLQIISIEEQLEISFRNKSKSLMEKLKEKYFSYHDALTGGVLMTPSFIEVEDSFRKTHDTFSNVFITFLKNAIHKIHKF